MPEKIAELMASMVTFNLPGYITIGICAPILEELIFRGIILRGLLNRYHPKKAIIWSAVIFGIAHLNPWQFIAAFSIGLFMGWVYYRTKSIFPGIFIHWFNNSISFALGAYFSDMNATFYDISGSITNYILLVW
jgi:membrane protease YdiL (CAAX protease family)